MSRICAECREPIRKEQAPRLVLGHEWCNGCWYQWLRLKDRSEDEKVLIPDYYEGRRLPWR